MGSIEDGVVGSCFVYSLRPGASAGGAYMSVERAFTWANIKYLANHYRPKMRGEIVLFL